MHEGPARISKLGATPLKRGMILSNEPGYYKRDAFGIRIENLILGLGERAEWPWLQPPPDGPRVPAEQRVAVERETGMVIHGPPPPSRGGAA